MSFLYFFNLQGILGSNSNTFHSPRIQTYSWGMTDDFGAIEPDLVEVTLESGKWSPKILKAFATKQEIGTAKISVFTPNFNGVEAEIQTLTLTGVVIKYHHVSAANDGNALDTIRMSFQSIKFTSENWQMLWSVPA